MLELRPNCEWCDCDLPPDDARARICSYECTYCATCVQTHLKNVCPTCGGNFVPRPTRPRREWRSGSGLGLGHHPASLKRRHSHWDEQHVQMMADLIAEIPPEER